jgi:hypothetical protein
MLRRLARELSDRMGSVTLLLGVEREELVRMILFERGRIVDEYLSVPEFYGPLPPGDVIGLAANPTVLARLTVVTLTFLRPRSAPSTTAATIASVSDCRQSRLACRKRIWRNVSAR